jgi:high-affinity nickel-transport protein
MTFDTRRSFILMYVALTLFNATAWGWALVAFRDAPWLLGTAIVAYGLGLRHAFDADHIAAIDNVTRRLVRGRQRPIGVGLYFALGHSTVVVLATVAVAFATTTITGRYGMIARDLGGVLGTAISALFLFAIALMNLGIFVSLLRNYRRLRTGAGYCEETVESLLNGRGILARLLRPLFRLIRSSRQMYAIGFLFGLGFDTATEIALLGIAAAAAAKGSSASVLMVFPCLFAAGMSLMDATDGVLMASAYGWALTDPARTLRYNLAITLLSVLIALLIGGIEVIGLLADRTRLPGGPWPIVSHVEAHFSEIGVALALALIGLWIGSVLVHRSKLRDPLALESV